MIQYFLLFVSFVELFLGFFWIQTFFVSKPQAQRIKSFPLISVIVPARNEEKTLGETISSLLQLNYPIKKLQIIIVNDGSTDHTAKIAGSLIANNPSFNILLIHRKQYEHSKKAAALNSGLKYAKGEFVGCLDSDTSVSSKSLQTMLPHFEDPRVGAVISTIRVTNHNTLYGKIQRLEYIFTTFIRSLMSRIGTLHITPGALSLYRTNVLKDMGGFDEKSLTEDFEIAMRLRYNHYLIKMEPKSTSYTKVPDTFQSFWNQRIRWFRGFIITNAKYKQMFGNTKFGIFGIFQYPVNILAFFIVLVGFSLASYEISRKFYNFFIKLFLLGKEYMYIVKIPSLKDVIFQMNFALLFPIFISLLLGFYFYVLAHKFSNEKIRYPFSTVIFFTLYPFLRSMHWVVATFKEINRSSEKW